MNVGGQDIHQTLEYRSAAAIVRLLPTGLLLIFLSLLIVALVVEPEREEIWTYVGAGISLIIGTVLVGFTLWRRVDSGKPLFTLAPDGIRYRIPLIKEVLIPWHVIEGVDTVDIEGGYWTISWLRQNPTWDYERLVACNVTVILLPKQFYDQRIFVGSMLLRGPGWKMNFIPKGSQVQMALHHEFVSVDPRALREAVEARWLAFRDRPDAESARASAAAPTAQAVAMGDNPKTISRWQITQIVVLLIGIAVVSANLAGLWQFSGKSPGSDARAKARTEQKDWADSIRRNREESKKLEAEQKELRRQLDEDMRRMFSR